MLALLYFLNAARFRIPTGYAGLYSLMTERLIQNPWPLPREIPLYGPGGIPFAFPPLGPYVAALGVGLLKIPIFEYLRWAPPAFTILSLIMLYSFALKLYASRDKAMLGTLLAAAGVQMYADHATAAGMVRALALLFATAGLSAFMNAIRMQTSFNSWTAATAFLLGLTTLTHPSYAVFLASGLTVIAASDRRESFRTRAVGLLVVLIGGLIVAAPWILVVSDRFGLQVWSNASRTHGTLGILQRVSGNLALVPVEILRWVANLGKAWTPHFLPGMAILGLGYSLLGRNWAIPALLVFLPAVLGESTRFEGILGGLLAANLIVDVAPLRIERNGGLTRFAPGPNLTFHVIVLGAVMYQAAKTIYSYEPSLDASLLEATTWVRENTPIESALLLLPNDHDRSEWTPYLTRRILSISHWGAEWAGGYAYQQTLQDQLSGCIDADSFRCIVDLTEQLHPQPTYLLMNTDLEALLSQAQSDPAWATAFRSDAYALFQRR